MQIEAGDFVRTKEGQIGEVILINRLSAFVKITEGEQSTTISRLLSELTKIEPESQAAGESPPEPT
jgi:hypothetical protein